MAVPSRDGRVLDWEAFLIVDGSLTAAAPRRSLSALNARGISEQPTG
jgi:hypothetical protein